MSNELFAIPVHVERADPSRAPDWVGGAFVVCYAAAPDHVEAARRAVAKLAAAGLVFVEMAGDIQRLDSARWDEYVTTNWIEFEEVFPQQEELPHRIASGDVFFGPFCAYETS